MNLRQPKLSTSYKESVAATFQSMNVTFLTFSLELLSSYIRRDKGDGGGSDFSSHKYGAVGKIGGVLLKK